MDLLFLLKKEIWYKLKTDVFHSQHLRWKAITGVTLLLLVFKILTIIAVWQVQMGSKYDKKIANVSELGVIKGRPWAVRKLTGKRKCKVSVLSDRLTCNITWHRFNCTIYSEALLHEAWKVAYFFSFFLVFMMLVSELLSCFCVTLDSWVKVRCEQFKEKIRKQLNPLIWDNFLM